MLKRTALFERHLALGAKMVPFAGWEMPVSYPAGIIAEHLAVRKNCGIFDIGHMGLLKILNPKSEIPACRQAGRNNIELLNLIQKFTTNDASRLEVNQCQYSVLCNENGGTVDDILVYRLPENYMIIANASNTDKVLSWLGPATLLWENHSTLSLQGPRAVELVEQDLTIPLADLKRNHTLIKQGILFSRTGYTGEDGVEIIAPNQKIVELWSLFIEKGIQPCGLGSRDTLRLEAGLPLYGHEYDETTSPLDAGYSWAVKLGKGEFIGRESLLRGPKKTLVGLEMSGRNIPRQGAEVFESTGAKKVGVVTSGTFSPTFGKPIALAYLEGEGRGKGQGEGVLVDIRGTKQPGVVVDKAFYKRVK